MKDASSTDLVVHGGEILTSFWQCGELYRLDADTLDTLGPTRWGDWFPPEGVSAHTKVDEATGELFFFNYGTVAPYLHFGVVDRHGRLVHYTPVPLPGPRLPHDMAITEHFVVLNDLPMHWDEDLLQRGVHAVRMHDEPTRLAVVPRRGTAADVQWFEADPTYVLHWTNAYEDGDDVVLEGFHQGSPSPRPAVDDELWMFRYLALDWMEARLHRWRLNRRTGVCTEERMRDDFTEFGIINGRRTGRPHRYVWAARGEPGWFLFDGLVRHDTETGADDLPSCPKACCVRGRRRAQAPRDRRGRCLRGDLHHRRGERSLRVPDPRCAASATGRSPGCASRSGSRAAPTPRGPRRRPEVRVRIRVQRASRRTDPRVEVG